MEQENNKPAREKKKIYKVVLITLAVLLVGVIIWGVAFYNGMLNKIGRFGTTDRTMSDEELAAYLSTAEGEEWDGSSPLIDLPEYFDTIANDEELIGGEIINIMLVGQDTRNAEKRGLSDTMILVSINRETKKMVLTSFMRDLYIDIVGLKTGLPYRDRLNTAYCTGGIKQLGETLELNFGVEIDNFVEVDFTAFQKIVDALGGVDMELTYAEANHLNTKGEYKDYGWTLVEGVNHLDGAQALAYSRIRKIDSDFQRTERQRKMLTALFELVKELNIMEMVSLAEEFLPEVTTDMSNADITAYLVQLAPILADLEVETLRIPIDGTWSGMNAGTEETPKYVLGCFDLTTNRETLRNAIGSEIDE